MKLIKLTTFQDRAIAINIDTIVTVIPALATAHSEIKTIGGDVHYVKGDYESITQHIEDLSFGR